MESQLFFHQLREVLKAPLPGRAAQDQMLIPGRDKLYKPLPREQAIPAAVLLLLFPHANDVHFFLTKRTQEVEHHKGQISLPGGRWESGERLYETALRETQEEIGIAPETVTFLGPLTPLFVPVTGYLIHPFIGAVQQNPPVTPHAREVDTLFSVSIQDLIDDQNQRLAVRRINGIDVEVPYFQLGSYKVWGATSMILAEFKTLLKKIPHV